jgi:hypothetical protein
LVNGKNFENTSGWRAMDSDTEVYLSYEKDSLDTIIEDSYAATLVLKNNAYNA